MPSLGAVSTCGSLDNARRKEEAVVVDEEEEEADKSGCKKEPEHERMERGEQNSRAGDRERGQLSAQLSGKKGTFSF